MNENMRDLVQTVSAQQLHTVSEQMHDAVVQYGKDSFPSDPILLLQLTVRYVDGFSKIYYALNKDYINPNTSQVPVYYDIIIGDGVKEMAFAGCSIEFMKIVFCHFNEVASIADLTVIDLVPGYGKSAIRASKVLRSIPGTTFTV